MYKEILPITKSTVHHVGSEGIFKKIHQTIHFVVALHWTASYLLEIRPLSRESCGSNMILFLWLRNLGVRIVLSHQTQKKSCLVSSVPLQGLLL